ncbi:unnamed protein product [marine sediment metagenome]|uniref:Uncharacterized protein n=1 Tax=marine sediment metagenome TaxID=412755 RepID=X1LPH9_9ZZZZ
MRIHSDGKIISLDREEALKLCRPGAGADTCIWLVVGGNGFECLYYNRKEGLNLEGETLEERWKKGLTVAKRDGCNVVRRLELDK